MSHDGDPLCFVKPFSLLVKPACADCNLRCEYCFYLGHASLYPETVKHRMSESVLERMISSFMATQQPQHAIGWQGGEPTLMGVDFFKRATFFQEKYGRSGSVVSNGLQTNGTLLDDEFGRHLAQYNFLVGVSLDGPPEVHDRYRTYVDGRGAHADVMRGIDVLRRNHVDFNVLTLVSQSNVRKPRDIYHYLCDQGFLFHQYIECVEFSGEGDLKPYAVKGEEWGDFLCGIYDEWIKADTRRVSVRLFDSILTILVDGVANTCSLGRDCRQYFVVEHNGDVYPCDFFVDRELTLGNVMDGEWEEFAASPIYEAFGQRKREWNSACDACEFVQLCSGDCPKNRMAQGRDPRQLSSLCKGWKQFHAHTRSGFERLANGIRAERQAAMAPPRVPAPLARPGRNDPCPCGSGKKYKKCCGAR